MKTRRALPALCVLLMAGVGLPAQDAASAPPPPTTAAPQRTAQELEQLVGPIALYPDALIALILPAATAPADIVLAARHLRDFPSDRSQIEHRAWDESVKSLTHYAEVLRWMDENLDWTKQLGEAFTEQPADVMQAVQRLRARARAAGTLIDTPQQQVIAEPQVIRIVPAQPDVIYVPHYEPEIVFVDRPVYYSRPFVTFGVGVAVGSWLAFDCDWHRHTIWVGNRHRRWTGHDWRRPVVPIAPSHARPHDVRPWRPSTPLARTGVAVSWHSRAPVARPSAFGSTTSRSYAPRAGSSDGRRETTALPVANALPRASYDYSNRDLPGPRMRGGSSAAPAVVPPLPMARNRVVTAAPAPVPTPAPTVAPAARPVLNNGGNRDYRSRQSQASTVQALPSAPSIPMAGSARSAPVMGPVAPPAARSYSQSRSQPAPAAVPSLPMASSARGAPVATVAPATAPAAVTAPAAAPATAPARNADNDNRRGRRDQVHEH